VVYKGSYPVYPVGELILGSASRLDAFSGYPIQTWLTSGAPGGPLSSPTPAADRDRTVSRRSKPSSRTALMGEQPNPWDLLQPQDAMSRHRGAKPPRRCGLLGEISLLSLEYLLSVERRRSHLLPPDH